MTVGANSADHAAQVMDYYPRTITVDAGDTVTFTSGAGPHRRHPKKPHK